MQTTSAGGYSGATQPTHIWDYWAVVMKRIPLVILFCFVSVSLSYFITQRQQKLYRATATIQIVPPNVLGPADVLSTPAIVSDDTYLLTQLQILTTPETVTTAVHDANLVAHLDFAGKSEPEIVRMAAGRVECSRRRNLYLVDVSVVGTDPKVLAHLANALVTTFKDKQKSASRKLRDARKSQLTDDVNNALSQIRLLNIDKSTALKGANFAETTFQSEYEKILASRERFATDDDKLYSDLMVDEPIANAIKQARTLDPAKGTESIAQLQFVRMHPRVKELADRIAQLGDEKDELVRTGSGPNNDRIKDVEARIQLAMRQREHVINGVVEEFLIDYEGKQKTHAGLLQQIERKTQELTAAAAVKRVVDEKNFEIERYGVIRGEAARTLEVLDQNNSSERDAVLIEQSATEPPAPYSPIAATNLTMGLVFGVVGGVALAFLLDYLDDTIRTKDELAKIAPDVPLLGIVPNIEARKSDTQKKDLFAANQPKSTISEAYRGVRTALTLSARGPQQKAMLLTSAGPREGKTTTAINLATVLAFSGARTLVIDADLRKPRVHASFGLPNNKGLTNLIVGEEDPVEACQRTSIERVDVLTSGPIPPNPSELLGRPRMREILRKLRDRYDHIIVDTPPIGAVTDAAVIATMVDGVILVVHAGKTRRQIVSRGIEQLRYISAPIVGVILNNLNLGRGRYYPGYYHYYYYYASHYGAEDGEAKKGKGGKPAKTAAPPAPTDPSGGPTAS